MACGNNGDEGESGRTYNSIQIVPYCSGYLEGTLNKIEVVEKNVVDFTLSLLLADSYPVCENCWLDLQWSSDFIPSWVDVNGKLCGKVTSTQTNLFCKV